MMKTENHVELESVSSEALLIEILGLSETVKWGPSIETPSSLKYSCPQVYEMFSNFT